MAGIVLFIYGLLDYLSSPVLAEAKSPQVVDTGREGRAVWSIS
jgi:hypothetical protein